MCGPLKGEAQQRGKLPTVNGAFPTVCAILAAFAPVPRSVSVPSISVKHLPSAVVIMSGAWQLSSHLIVHISQHVLPAADLNKGSAGCFGVSVLQGGSPHRWGSLGLSLVLAGIQVPAPGIQSGPGCAVQSPCFIPAGLPGWAPVLAVETGPLSRG